MIRPTRITALNKEPHRLCLKLDHGELCLLAINKNCLRVQMRFADAAALEYGLAAKHNQAQAELHAAWPEQLEGLDGQTLSLALGDYLVHVHQQPFYLSVERNGQTIYSDLPGRAYKQDSNLRRWHYHQRDDQDRHYGLGEKSGHIERTGRRLKMNNVDAVGYDPELGDGLYKHIPFLLRYRPSQEHCIGLYYHNANVCEFDLGSERSGYWGPYSSYCVDDGVLDYFLLLGPSPRDVLHQYLDLTGRPALPTKASLGYMGSTMYYTELPQGCDQAVLGFVDECKHNQIPLSGFHLSSGYTKGEDGKRYTFHWNPETFSQPAEFVQSMTARGQVLSPNVKPGLLTSHPLYKEFDGAGAFIRSPDNQDSQVERFWGGEASFVDFSNPEGRALWQKHLTTNLIDLGITSIWNDNNEFEMDDDGALCAGDGQPVPARSLRPVLSNLMAETAYNAVRDASEQRPFILSRAGFAGIQQYAQTWSGDNSSSWHCFRYNVATMLGMSLSGVAFNGMDIGGFTGPAPSPELFLRWVQNGIFHPRFCIHSVNDDNTVTEPWLYPSILPQIRQAFRLRYQLLPTLYSLAFQASTDGDPVVRPLVYHYPQDANTWQEDQSFLLGDSLLCVALTEPDLTETTVYFPKGDWLDWYTGQQFAGGRHHTIAVCSEHSPLFIRAGSAVFLDQSYAAEQETNQQLQVRIMGQHDGQARFYDDDGKTMAYQSGEQLITQLDWQQDQRRLRLDVRSEGSYQPTWQSVLWSIQVRQRCPLTVNWNGRVLKQVLYQHQLDTESWYYDAEQKSVQILMPGASIVEQSQVVLAFDQAMAISMED